MPKGCTEWIYEGVFRQMHLQWFPPDIIGDDVWCHTHCRHAKARDSGRGWRSQSVMFSQKGFWNHQDLVPNWVMETMELSTVVNMQPEKKGYTLYTDLLCFGDFVLTAFMFYLPRPFFPGCLHSSSETRTNSNSKLCFEKNVPNSCWQGGQNSGAVINTVASQREGCSMFLPCLCGFSPGSPGFSDNLSHV